MPTEFRTKALVTLIRALESRTHQLGKTQLQKLVYFLQELGVQLGYKYEIYHYGPYCFELSNDLSSLDSLNILDVESDPNGFGFNIRLSRYANGYDPDPMLKEAVKRIVDKLGSNSAGQLEVKATIHFVQRVLARRGSANEDTVVGKVRTLKPHFAEVFVRKCYEELQQERLIA